MRTHLVWMCAWALLIVGISEAGSPQKNSAPQAKHAANIANEAAVAWPRQTRTPSEAAEDSSAAKLPVRRVILYKSGVGYFEHVGHVRDNQTVRIDFTSSQLNDVLQSLTVLDLNGGRIAGVDYNSEAPLG